MNMSSQLTKSAVFVIGFAAVTLLGLLPVRAMAESHPQEVLDLIAGHQALAMKIRPLQDRVIVAPVPKKDSSGFKPDGVPIRAKVSTTTGTSNSDTEIRAAERLRHKNRAASDSDEYGRIKVRFSTLEKKARAERERVNNPRFGVGLRQRDSESGDVRFGDGRRGSRPASGTGAQDKSGAKEIADARKALAALERELAALEREVDALER